jgi:hypothetical protein
MWDNIYYNLLNRGEAGGKCQSLGSALLAGLWSSTNEPSEWLGYYGIDEICWVHLNPILVYQLRHCSWMIQIFNKKCEVAIRILSVTRLLVMAVRHASRCRLDRTSEGAWSRPIHSHKASFILHMNKLIHVFFLRVMHAHPCFSRTRRNINTPFQACESTS